VAHLVQVGVGSGGMPVLDMVCRDARITQITVIEPDIFKPHNLERHCFAVSDIGQPKGEMAERWVKERRPDVDVTVLNCDLLDRSETAAIQKAVQSADIGICAADNEVAKYHWDGLMRRFGKPWTLGEVLSGGIGGFVHWFLPAGPCYGCVASFLQRSVNVDHSPAPDYSQPGGPKETTIPASKASISAIASLHACITLELLEEGSTYAPGFTSLLFTLKRVSGVFDEAFKPYRFRIPRSADCLICRDAPDKTPSAAEDLDAALDQALARLGDA
jgi:hypothetical protein